MDVPEVCSVCGRQLRRIKHMTAHGGMFSWDAHVLTCPHNLGERCHTGGRHDEWHEGERGWVQREVD